MPLPPLPTFRSPLNRGRHLCLPFDAGLTAALTVGALTLYPASRQATWRDAVLDLTGTAFSLEEVLARNAGKLVTKQDLSTHGVGASVDRP